jgi:hypothetical protein
VLPWVAAAAVMVGSVAGATGLLGVVGPVTAAGATPVAVTSTYTCTVFTQPFTVPISFSGTIPGGVDPDHTARVTGFQATITLPATLVGDLVDAHHGRSIAGAVTTLLITATTTFPPVRDAAASPLPFGPAELAAGEPLVLTVPQPAMTLGPFRAGDTGTISISPTTVTLHAAVRTTSTTTTDLDMHCHPVTSGPLLGQIPVLEPFIVSGPLDTATQGVAYSDPLPVVGGTGPYTWSIPWGALPPGLVLDAQTGVVSGTPTTVGTWTFGLSVVDANGYAATGAASIAVQVGSVPGYQFVASDGGIFSYGGAKFDGSMGGKPLNAPIVGSAFTPGLQGYWEVASDGGMFAYGDARFYGSMGGKPLNRPIVGMAATPDGQGYWEVASDGGLFSYGDAKFYGSMGGKPLVSPIVGMATTPDGLGYWEVASDGGLFSYGDAKFYGSMGGKPLTSPIVAMVPSADGKGYWEVASDGGIFAFGDARYFGSMGSKPLDSPIVGMAATPDGLGYWEVAADGGIFAFGDARFLGSMGGKPLDKPIVGIASGLYQSPTQW